QCDAKTLMRRVQALIQRIDLRDDSRAVSTGSSSDRVTAYPESRLTAVYPFATAPGTDLIRKRTKSGTLNLRLIAFVARQQDGHKNQKRTSGAFYHPYWY